MKKLKNSKKKIKNSRKVSQLRKLKKKKQLQKRKTKKHALLKLRKKIKKPNPPRALVNNKHKVQQKVIMIHLMMVTVILRAVKMAFITHLAVHIIAELKMLLNGSVQLQKQRVQGTEHQEDNNILRLSLNRHKTCLGRHSIFFFSNR